MANQSEKFKKRKLIKEGLGKAGHVTRNSLERLGGLIDSVNAHTNNTSKYDAVDLDNFNVNSSDNLFSQQTLKASQQLLGNRFATYGKYAKKVVPDSAFKKVADGAFSQVAKLAASWSEIDLPNEHRFDGIQNISEHERNALARDIANQNRALAILGSVTGLVGLPGLIADTLWLLLVSLRTVYQLATVYDKPLTGKQGIKMAYAVLSKADLSAMQEKQAILAGLGMAKGLLDNADNQGFRNELKNMGVKSNSVTYYAEQVDKIAEQFDINIDGINLGWITKFLPMVSVGIGAHYNHNLINEVIGVANATFGPEPKEAKTALTDGSEQADADSKRSVNLDDYDKEDKGDSKDSEKEENLSQVDDENEIKSQDKSSIDEASNAESTSGKVESKEELSETTTDSEAGSSDSKKA